MCCLWLLVWYNIVLTVILVEFSRVFIFSRVFMPLYQNRNDAAVTLLGAEPVLSVSCEGQILDICLSAMIVCLAWGLTWLIWFIDCRVR